jgi:hypothetical protein
VEGAAELAKRWRGDWRAPEDAKEPQTGARYQFNIRDFHLLDGLARDPGNSREDRASLVGQLAQSSLPGRRTMRPAAGVESYLLGEAVSKMNMADLWNVWLLNEMLCRTETRSNLRKLAEADMADTTSAWGGLVTYDPALRRAELTLYRPSRAGGGDDERYLASAALLAAAPMSMCRFHAHFDRVNNSRRAGPSRQEVQEAVVGNYSALVVTRLSENEFCAYYYNPSRVVLSLGTFMFSD